MSTDQPIRRPGRPRNEQSNQAILQAARELIADHGVQSFSMEQLAARAGVSKPTIYRRWQTKEDLLSDVFGYAAEQTNIPDTGDALTDLHLLLDNMLKSFEVRFGASPTSMHRVIAVMIDSPQFLEQYKEHFINPRRQAYSAIIQRGKQRGQIRSDADEEILIDLVSGAYMYCLLLKPESLSSGAWLDQVRRLLEYGVSAGT